MVSHSSDDSRILALTSKSGFSSALFTLSILAAGTIAQGPYFPVWQFITENYIPLLTMNIIISYALATYVYIKSFAVKSNDPSQRELAQGGVSGNIIYDWYIGRELNPRLDIPFIGNIDIKSWMELRPGMLGWIVLDLAFIMAQWRTYGKVTDSICKPIPSNWVSVISNISCSACYRHSGDLRL